MDIVTEGRCHADDQRDEGGGAADEGRFLPAEGDREGILREGSIGEGQTRQAGLRAEDFDEESRAGEEAGGTHA